MVAAKGYRCIEFVRIMNLLGIYTQPAITKEHFIALLEPSRHELMERYGDPHFDANACIKNDPDYKLTFDGYAKFLRKDLAHGPIRDKAVSRNKYKTKVHDTAKVMIARGVVCNMTPLQIEKQRTNAYRPSPNSSWSNIQSMYGYLFTLRPG